MVIQLVCSEEQRGPYIYVLATVKKVHFEERMQNATQLLELIPAWINVLLFPFCKRVMCVYMCVKLSSNNCIVEWMEPPQSARGEAATLCAATESQAMNQSHRGLSQNVGGLTANCRSEKKCVDILEAENCFPLTPFFWLDECFVNVVGKSLYLMGRTSWVQHDRKGSCL